MPDFKKAADLNERIIHALSNVIIGATELKMVLVVALLAGGHVLIEGVPGTGKTKLANTFARAIGGAFKRVQFVPDMLPSDITGFYFYTPAGQSELIRGPIFANVLLADELNRATPRTQSALLEAMQEQQVTIERDTFTLPYPFMVIATQQEAGAEGTYPLTNVQMDRFLLRSLSHYQGHEEEARIISTIDRIEDASIEPVIDLKEIQEIRTLARQVHVSPKVVEYITRLVDFLRRDPDIASSPSTRASITLYKVARVLAMMENREFVIPDDVKTMALNALEHRISLRPEAEMGDLTRRAVVERALHQVEVPK